MIYLHEFDLSEFNSDSFKNAYLEYRIGSSETLQKDIIEAINIPATTFKRAKTNGFTSNPKVYDALAKYFKIQDIKIAYFNQLVKEWNTLFTYIWYTNAQEQQNCFERLMILYKETQNTHLEVLTIALISISMNTMFYKEDLSILTDKVKMLETLSLKVNTQNKAFLTYSLYEYALHLKDLKLAVHYANIIEPLIPMLDSKFGSLMNYGIMNASFFSRDFLKGIVYANKVLEFQNECYSSVIRTSCIYVLTTFYSMLKDYDKIIKTAENEIIGLQFDETHQLQYFSMLSALITAYVAKERYDEAQKLMVTLRDYKFEDHTSINKAYYQTLSDRQNMSNLTELFINYKQKDLDGFEIINKKILDEGNEDRVAYAQMISLLQKPNKTNIKKLESMLQARSNEKMILSYSNIHYLIKTECDKIKF